MNNSQILVVEDEMAIAEVLLAYLQQAGFSTHHLARGNTVETYVREQTVDLILLDLMLPDIDGVTICKTIRRFSEVPIIMVTAKVEEIDRLLGLELGADDYICKPFSAREVVARVKAVLRRNPMKVEEDIDQNTLTLGPIFLNTSQYKALIQKQPLELTPKEFQMLEMFVRNPERVFSRDHILSALYKDANEVSDRAIDSHIKNLRKKLQAVNAEYDWIQAIYGVGYKFSVGKRAD